MTIIPGIGPGSEIFAPAAIKGPEIFGRSWHSAQDDFGLIVAAGENADGLTLDGRFGLGVRTHESAFVASGAEFSLSYAGAGGSAVPDVQLHTKDAAAANSTSGSFYFNGYPVETYDYQEVSETLPATNTASTVRVRGLASAVANYNYELPSAALVDGYEYRIANAGGSSYTLTVIVHAGDSMGGVENDTFPLAPGDSIILVASAAETDWD